MTSKRDRKDEPTKRPKLTKETVKDLDAKETGVKGGGRRFCTNAPATGCAGNY